MARRSGPYLAVSRATAPPPPRFHPPDAWSHTTWGRLVVEETLGGKRVAQVALPAPGRMGTSSLPIEALAFSPDGKTLAMAYGILSHHWLAFVDLPSGALRTSVLDEFDGGSYRLVWSPNGKLLAGGDAVGFILRRYGSALLRPPLLSETLGGEMEAHNDPAVRSVRAYSPFFRNGRPYATDGSGIFALDEVGRRPDVHTGAARVVVAPDGAWAARPMDDESVEVFRPAERAYEPGTKAFARFPAEPSARLDASGEGRWLVVPHRTGFDVYDVRE